jgi:hypothetical protein
MHTSLRVIGVLSDPTVSVVLGFGFCWWASVEAVHEPAGVTDARPVSIRATLVWWPKPLLVCGFGVSGGR